ncbi:hypothetical protein SBOR_1085 [Sclerotinia borealis F-4128]|uniref:Uncharacterized protein n=1 Tax=Sclerotinia borealis (strain F-4128) TaxID=1432307 RepID=W9CR38_SCLBF|nr:hypothetical protein SBOR_1085 [Sclerotinia borealis F-4128]
METPLVYTPLAESHTHPTGADHIAIRRLPGLLKSGITPITPPPYENYYRHKAHQDLKWYQTERFGGFTTQEIHLHDAFAPYSRLRASGKLTCPIHPMLQRSKWRRQLPAQLARYPLGNGREGYWDAWENDRVWNMMVPALQLTTMFLANLYTWPWFDALFFGAMEEVDAVDLPPEHRGKRGYRKFKLRPPYISAQENERRRVQAMLERFSDDVTFDLSSGHTDSRSGLPDEFEFANTSGSLDLVTKKGISISMAFEILEPLFNTKITEAEYMIVLYRFGGTLMHELCHAFWDCLRKWGVRAEGEDVIGQDLEPWFEDERTSELGFSMEKFVFGGITQDFLKEDSVPCRGIPPMGFYLFGARSTHVPKLYGKRTINRPDGLPPAPPSAGFENVDTAIDAMMMQREPMNDVMRGAYWFRNSYKQRTYEIQNALMAHGHRETTYPISGWPPESHGDSDDDDEDDEDSDEEEEDNANKDDEDDEEVPLCPRYDEIKNYLIRQRRELAIDTLKFRMPEHLFYEYIRRNGGLYLSAEEWRGFLLNSTERKELFQIRDKNGRPPTPYHAIFRRLSAGWPTGLPAGAPPVNVAVSKIQEVCFFHATENYLVERKAPWHRTDFWDADVEIFRALCNNWLIENRRGAPLEKDVFEACIQAGVQPRFVHGPRGIVRRLPESPPQPKRPQKRSAQGSQSGRPAKHRAHRNKNHERIAKIYPGKPAERKANVKGHSHLCNTLTDPQIFVYTFLDRPIVRIHPHVVLSLGIKV